RPPAATPGAVSPAPKASRARSGGGMGKAPFIWGTGRRKTAVARVRIRRGDGKFIINKRSLDDYFRVDKDRLAARRPLAVAEVGKGYDVFVNVRGGGMTGQAGAVMLGLARALAKADDGLTPKLRENKLMTRDPRKVERKKYGRRGARRSFQFSKR
ncbi:MAG: 30S ribosomal protein S9, partial [Phycisphaerae bacterium]